MCAAKGCPIWLFYQSGLEACSRMTTVPVTILSIVSSDGITSFQRSVWAAGECRSSRRCIFDVCSTVGRIWARGVSSPRNSRYRRPFGGLIVRIPARSMLFQALGKPPAHVCRSPYSGRGGRWKPFSACGRSRLRLPQSHHQHHGRITIVSGRWGELQSNGFFERASLGGPSCYSASDRTRTS